MLTRLRIKNYQSHADTDIELGGLTVLVGPSSAGKSAVARAIKALASNATGKDFITHGETTMQVLATTDKGTVTLTKGKPEDSYVILENADPQNPKRYTKLGREVPADVTAFLGIAPREAINFAGQFDMPYLLTASASETARTLGDLTNVATIFEAARETLRRKNAFNSTLTTRKGDLSQAEAKIETLSPLKDLDVALQAAEQWLGRANEVKARIDRLNDIMLSHRTAKARLTEARTRADVPVPSTDGARLLMARWDQLNGIIADLVADRTKQSASRLSLEEHTTELADLNAQYEALLIQAGTCPMCGQGTEHIHAA